MNHSELFDVVNDHPEAWPDDVRHCSDGFLLAHDGDGEPGLHEFVMPDQHALLAFEASFHRAIRKHTYCMRVEDHGDMMYVIVKHHQFEAASLIEAYAKALEWLK
jgi:hypothetical protein